MDSICSNEEIFIRNFTKNDLVLFEKFTPYKDLLLTDYNLCFLDEKEKRHWKKAIESKKNKYFGIFLRETNVLIGYISVKKGNFLSSFYELSISFDAKYSSKGYGFISLKMFLKYFFENISNSIWLNVNSFNKRAIGLYEKIGFEKISEFLGDFEVQNFQNTESFRENKDNFVEESGVIYTKVFSMKLDKYIFMERCG